MSYVDWTTVSKLHDCKFRLFTTLQSYSSHSNQVLWGCGNNIRSDIYTNNNPHGENENEGNTVLLVFGICKGLLLSSNCSKIGSRGNFSHGAIFIFVSFLKLSYYINRVKTNGHTLLRWYYSNIHYPCWKRSCLYYRITVQSSYLE